ncbi:MAG TPA: DUF4445 domain-containing protein, partial [Armatimonadetes bacterium]|nr:DUF4445 domain-containing protein [Armatimonadota bacterium]
GGLRVPEQRYRIRFLPEGVSVEVDANTSLLNAARNVGIDIMSVCGGEGTCGKCLVRVLAGRVRQSDRVAILNPALRAEGYTLACQTFPLENLTVEVPVESRLDSTDVVIRHTEVEVPEYEVGLETYQHSPLACRMQLTLRPPTLTENASDLTRLLAGLRRVTNDARTSHVTNTKGCIFGGTERPIGIALSALRELPNALRDGDWKVTVTLVNCCDRWEVTRVTSGHDAQPAYGAAIDVGTTTITVYLVNMHTGETVQRLATYNEQFVYGEDVITRIVYATRNEDGLEHLRRAALRTINQLLDHAINAMKISRDDIACAVVAGNTVMTHLLLGIEPKYIRLEPYIPAAVTYPPIKAREVGIGIHQEGHVFTFPCVASYVGGDIVAGALVSGMGLRSEVGLFVDIGTNGEMVLGNKDYLVTCACSAGPAFEGSGITCGMRSVRGAIESVEVNSSDLQILVKTIGN